MKIQPILKRCEESGHKVTKMGLYYSGKKYGFLVKDENGKYFFNEELFQEWLKKSLEEVPEGYLRISECAKKLNMCVASIWRYSKNVETKKIGAGEGIIYVNFKQLEEFIRFNRKGSEEKNGK